MVINTGHMTELEREYPSLFGGWTISSYVGPGWVELLRPCLAVLHKHNCLVGQIKAKFCELRLYWDAPGGLSDDGREEIETAIRHAEGLSLNTCEKCGAETNNAGSGRMMAGIRLCSNCEHQKQ